MKIRRQFGKVVVNSFWTQWWFLWERYSQFYKWHDAVGWLSIAVIFTSIFSRKLIRVLCSYVYNYMYVYVCICLWIYTFWIYSLSTLENTDENGISVRSPHHKHFGKAQHLAFWALCDISCSLFVNPSHTDESWEGRNTCLWIYIYLYIIKI